MTRLPAWLVYALLFVFCWGLWGFFAKIGSGRMSPDEEQILFTVGMVPIALAALWKLNWKLETDRAGVGCGILNGVLAALGMVAYYAAMQRGQASTISAVTGLFPLLTVFLAVVFLRERINRVQAAGIVAAVGAVLLLST
jgi:transporter family protein